MSEPRRQHLWLVPILLLAALLRLPALSWLPSPAGDEGHWTLYGYQILTGQGAALAGNAAFVSLLYARLIAVSMWILGPGFLASRMVNAGAMLAAIPACYLLLVRLGSRRGGLALAILLAVHPWSVAYSRISSVPYGLACALMLVGCLLVLDGMDRRGQLEVAAGVLSLSVGAHFSPLTLVAAVAVGLHALGKARRWVFGRPVVWLAVALGGAQALPVVRSAMAVARAAPDLAPLAHFWPRLGSYLHMLVTGLAGEATLRHFTNLAWTPRTALLLAPPVVALVLLAGLPRTRAASRLAGFPLVYVAVALVLIPLILAPGREWEMPGTHQDRYLFALLPGFGLCVAAVAARPARWSTLAVGIFLGWLALGTGRLAWAFFVTGGVDHGEVALEGGSGYRGWLVSDQPRSTMERIREVVLADPGSRDGVVLVADRTFIPLGFVMRGTGIPVYDVRRTWIPPVRSGRYYVVLWPDSVLSVGDPPTAPPKYVKSNAWLRERMRAKFRDVERLALIRQRSGAPLLEVWRAREPIPPRLAHPRPPRRRRGRRTG